MGQWEHVGLGKCFSVAPGIMQALPPSAPITLATNGEVLYFKWLPEAISTILTFSIWGSGQVWSLWLKNGIDEVLGSCTVMHSFSNIVLIHRVS